MNALIITIGDEILQGQTIDTNATFLASELTNLSVSVEKIISISDNRIAITQTLDASVGRYNIILLTGGLGPTSDDITKLVLAEYFDSELIEHADTLINIENLLQKRNKTLINKYNKQQALVPSKCEVIKNELGTAPAMLFEQKNSIIISMPGVPFEMKNIFINDVIPILRKKLDFPSSYMRIINTFGIAESDLFIKLEKIVSDLPENIRIAFLPSPEVLKIKLSSFGGHKSRMLELIEAEIQKINKIIGKNIFGYDNDTLESRVGQMLIENNLTLSIAESCTGGGLGNKLTSLSGSSGYFQGGIISYSNETKINILGVKASTIDKYGAVSKETVEEMVKGAIKLFSADLAVSITGIAGPAGGTLDKPVGTVWIAIASKNNIISQKYFFANQRDINIRRTVATALFMLQNSAMELLKKN